MSTETKVNRILSSASTAIQDIGLHLTEYQKLALECIGKVYLRRGSEV